MTYTNDWNPGAPFGARWDDDYPTGPAPRAERHTARNPWAGDGTPEVFRMPRTRKVIPGGPGAGESTPCAGKWDLFDSEEPGPEALSLCAACPFNSWCFSTASENGEHFTWAGTNRADRQHLTRGDLAA